MQTLKVFIVIEGDSGKDELRIDGNLETLRAFLSGVGSFEMQSAPMSPLNIPMTQAPNTKRKPYSLSVKKTKKSALDMR